MNVHRLEFTSWSDALPTGPVCLVIGVFDGVHAGHHELLRAARNHRTANGVETVVLTFDPHPARIVLGRHVPLIMSVEERVACVRDQGVDHVLGLSFTDSVAAMDEHDFIEVLCSILDIRAVFVGEDFCYGRHGKGDVERLESHGRNYGFSVRAVAKHQLLGSAVSSSRIRDAIAAGNMDDASALMGRPYAVTLQTSACPRGLWDARFWLPKERICPAFGGYLGRLEFEDGHIPVAAHIERNGEGGLLQLSLKNGAARPMPEDGRITLEFLTTMWDRSDVRSVAGSVGA